MTPLSETVRVERRFALSARLDSDLNGSPPLSGYVLQASVEKALTAMLSSVRDAKQYAFTWTGPYGGGKSCAALLVASRVAGRTPQRKLAHEIVGKILNVAFDSAFPGSKWRVLPVTGRRAPLTSDVAAAAAARFRWTEDRGRAASADDRVLIDALDEEARDGGLLIILDELGKFLEHAAESGGDAHFLQDLAERAARSDGRLIVVGILHQSFEQYSGRLGRSARDEWAKIQGRFQNIPFVAQPDEVVALLARAIQADRIPDAAGVLAVKTAAAIAQRRPIDEQALGQALERSWPLHPVTALLLGPLSRQRFAQNERSVFGFLSSAEPFGFQEYLAQTPMSDVAWYGPERLWDYLVANFGSALSVGPDGQRLTLALDAIERASLRGGLAARLTKAAALIELFRNGSGLAVSDDILALCALDESAEAISEALASLVSRAILIRQPRLGGYALFAGSDFDLDDAIAKAGGQIDGAGLLNLPERLGLGPVAAKRLYFETGALRTFDLLLQFADEVPADPTGWADEVATRLAREKRRATGVLVLLLPDSRSFDSDIDKAASALSAALEEKNLIAGIAIAPHPARLHDRAIELMALDRIEAAHPQLEGDRIARRELAARRVQASDAAREIISECFAAAKWWALGIRYPALDGKALPIVASQIGADAFPQAPIIQSELLCRDKPSSNAMAALRALGHAMVARASEPGLGLTGYPAERGLYLTILAPLGLHGPDGDGAWRFRDPDGNDQARSLHPAWRVLAAARKTSLRDLYDDWAGWPFGIKRGVMPLLALSFILAHRSSIALYVDGRFEAAVDDVFVDRMLQEPGAIELRRIARSKRDRAFIDRLATLLSTGDLEVEPETLPVAAALYQRIHALPVWTQRTITLDERTRSLRDIVLKASDPEALLFADLAGELQGEVDPAGALVACLHKLETAYPAMLKSLEHALADQLGVDPSSFEGIGLRSVTTSGVTADLRLDAFAMRAGAFEGGQGDIEGLASLLIHKPARNWSDREHDQALFELAKLARRFREAEAFASVKGRAPTAHAISMVIGIDPTQSPVFQTFEVTEQELAEADSLASELLAKLQGSKARTTVELAAIARMIERLSSGESVENVA